MRIKIAEVILDNGDKELIFDGLMNKDDFDLILDEFLKISDVKVIKQTKDDLSKACLMNNGVFEFVLVYSSDSFVWNYAYAVDSKNHELLKDLCSSFAELIT